MTSIVYPNAVAPAAERRTLTIAFVGALHLAVIYTILVALNIAPSPIPFHETGIKVLDPAKPKVDTDTTIPVHPTNWAHPVTDTTVPPVIDINRDTGGGGIPYIPPQGGTGDVFQTASAVASTHTIPDYPAFDRRLNHEGTVALAIAVDANGEITGATVIQSSGYDGLDTAAIAWVKTHWRYKPALKNGTAVPSTVRASVVFHLTTGRG